MSPTEIKRIRKRLNLTQEAFANAIGVAFVTINRWEKGVSHPSRLAIEKMLKLLETIEVSRERCAVR